jgi:uncharacterized protein (TIGR02284 family)
MKNPLVKLNEKEVSIVNQLIKICNERISGYTKAASEIRDAELKELFNQLAIQTEGLQKQLLESTNDIKAMHLSTSKISSVWESWIGLKSAITNGSRKAMLEACLTGEKSAIRSYTNALEENISAELRELIMSQLEQIENTYQNLKAIIHSI